MTAIFEQLAEYGVSAPVVVGGLVFFAVFLILFSVMQVDQRRRTVRRRAVAYNPASESPLDPIDPDAERLFAIEQALSHRRRDRLSKIRADMVQAGWFDADAVAYYLGARLFLGFGFALAAAVALVHYNSGAVLPQILAVGAAGAAVGAFLPRMVVDARQRAMLRQCDQGFPDFLDLLVVCAEVGMPPRAGIERVSREIVRSYPFLGANLFLMHLQIRAGRTVSETLASLAERVRLDEVSKLGALLHQTETLGTSVATTLRTFSEDMRVRRMLRAEEKAHALPAKLVLPLALFIFPVILVVVFLPVIVRSRVIFG